MNSLTLAEHVRMLSATGLRRGQPLKGRTLFRCWISNNDFSLSSWYISGDNQRGSWYLIESVLTSKLYFFESIPLAGWCSPNSNFASAPCTVTLKPVSVLRPELYTSWRLRSVCPGWTSPCPLEHWHSAGQCRWSVPARNQASNQNAGILFGKSLHWWTKRGPFCLYKVTKFKSR